MSYREAEWQSGTYVLLLLSAGYVVTDTGLHYL